LVARERELEQLQTFLDLVPAGQGRVVFVAGEAGSGKTALVQEFTRRSLNSRTIPSRWPMSSPMLVAGSVSLCRLWRQQGRLDEAREVLAEI
jgi:type II secretory pathway predicted ATPase ExeA